MTIRELERRLQRMRLTRKEARAIIEHGKAWRWRWLSLVSVRLWAWVVVLWVIP